MGRKVRVSLSKEEKTVTTAVKSTGGPPSALRRTLQESKTIL